MGLPDSRKGPISRGFQEISDMFPRTSKVDDIKMDVSSHVESVVSLRKS